MREQRNDPKRLKDILQAIDTIFEYVGDRGMEEFLADKKSYHAVIYNIMIIGEAANMLTSADLLAYKVNLDLLISN